MQYITDFLNIIPFPTKIVGGWVRNHLMNLQKTDIDLATEALPQDVMQWGQDNQIKVIATGLAHGTVTIIWEGASLEITTLRRDVETDGRHAKVLFSKNWEEDAKRRDFTMNSLYFNQNKEIEDYVGGIKDIQDRYVRFVGDQDQRIREDYLRIWRYYRFLTRYGDSRKHLILPLEGYKEGLLSLSKERILSELLKWLSVQHSYVDDMNVLFKIHFCGADIESLQRFENSPFNHDDYFLTPQLYSLFKVYLLFSEALPDFPWSNKQKKYFKDLGQALQEKDPQYLMSRFGYEMTLCYLAFHQREIPVFERFPLKGGDLMPFCKPHTISYVVDKTLRWWAQHPYPRPSKESCLDFVIKEVV